MAKPDILARVKADLAMGHTYMATQRLRTLVAVEPDDLEIYRLLAAVHRQTGNLVEAGRWSFLTDDLRPEELAAFEHANPNPWLRLHLIRWAGRPSDLPDRGARQRLADLVAEAERSGPPARWHGGYQARRPRGTLLPCLFVTVVLGAAIVLSAIGALRAISWIMP